MIDLFPSTEMFTIKEVADRLKIQVATIRDKVFCKQIPYTKLGTGKRAPVRFYGKHLNDWLTENEGGKSNLPVPEHNRKIKKANKKTLDEFSEYLENFGNEE